ncbi:hypothetical protein JOL62DRAFT_599743, partial [Phyllosticta paracitricarpa]
LSLLSPHRTAPSSSSCLSACLPACTLPTRPKNASSLALEHHPEFDPHPYPADLPHHCLFALDAHLSICGKHDSPYAHSPPTRRPAGSVARPSSSPSLCQPQIF